MTRNDFIFRNVQPTKQYVLFILVEYPWDSHVFLNKKFCLPIIPVVLPLRANSLNAIKILANSLIAINPTCHRHTKNLFNVI